MRVCVGMCVRLCVYPCIRVPVCFCMCVDGWVVGVRDACMRARVCVLASNIL